jgi:BlaI family penicillinase repressor
MAREFHFHDVTGAELAVLQRLWDAGPAPVRALAEALYPGGGNSAHATVQKLLERLENKRYVSRRRRGGVQQFAARIDKEGLIGGRLRAVAQQLCEGSLTPLLTHLVRQQALSPRERKELRDLLAELAKPSRPSA